MLRVLAVELHNFVGLEGREGTGSVVQSASRADTRHRVLPDVGGGGSIISDNVIYHTIIRYHIILTPNSPHSSACRLALLPCEQTLASGL